ncbi:DcaP family trimeric outer membrane transporter [uncultured Shewanella sp.]|uniref:DcaP family trimeric outer membrane transporter n=1 Tax=uncultured Shewanella sp. TaxID=173975 RepID=UPI0026369C96|nr:DcaP family trimeric outer membrane transporter [uncultured Shewanella sp.]
MLISKIKKIALAGSMCIFAGSAMAGYDFKVGEDGKISFGGYLKVDARYVNGDVAYRDFWIGTGTPLAEDASQFRIFANESRFNTKYVHGDVTGFIEMDFLGGGGNQVVSNSANPRIRHAFIKYQGITAGQTWTTFMNTSAIPETADFAGATVGLAFIRQGQVRFDAGNFQFSVENPESVGGDTANDDLPDVVARYNIKGDWGNVSISALGRSLNTTMGNSETAFGGSIAGRIKTFGKDDFRFQFHQGEVGRYVGVGTASDLIGEEVESTTSYLAAYRHYWTDTLRSTVLYGRVETDLADAERTQWSVNLFQNLTPQLAVGFEVGNFEMGDKNVDSDYAQLSMRYAL